METPTLAELAAMIDALQKRLEAHDAKLAALEAKNEARAASVVP